jgi:putative DNA primase/helicase
MVNFLNIPLELRELNNWVCWKKITLDNGKTTKIPINPITGSNAMANNPNTWSSFENAIKGVDKYKLAGIGFMFQSPYFGVDLDNPTDELKVEFISTLNSYTEISQSGLGIHIICKGKLPEGSRRKNGIEMYDSNRFFVMTGDSVNIADIKDCTKEIEILHNKYLGIKYVVQSVDVEVVDLEDNEVIKKAGNSKNGSLFSLLFAGNWQGVYPSQSEADMAFCFLLAFWTGKNKMQMDRIFRLSGLMRSKWERKQNGTTYGAITIENACNKTKDVYNKSHNDSGVTINAQTGEVIFGSSTEYELNDTGNARRFVDRYGEQLKYNFDNKQYMIWTGNRWKHDTELSHKKMSEIVIGEMKKDAMSEDDKELQKAKMKNVQHAFSSRGKEAMLRESIHLGSVPCTNADFDKNKKYFNTNSGIVDLSSGRIIPHEKSQMMSKISDVEIVDGEPVLWLKFLNEIFNGDKELIKFVQKAIGYTMTGSIKEQCMFICFGEGANGKSVFLDVVSAMLGDYAVNAQVDTLLNHRNNGSGGSSDLARLKGARMVTTGEPNEGSKFNEGLVKQLTGGDKITARFLYGKEFEFRPEFKIWLATNYRPVIRGTDQGIWRRIRLIPFEMKLPKAQQDKDLTNKLLRELGKIINWAINGCMLWLKEGLESPKIVEDATQEYRNDMDIINSFVEDMCQQVMGWEANATDVYLAYNDWAKKGNEYIMPLTRFGKEMAKRFEKTRKSQGVVYLNLRLKKDDTAYRYNKFEV